MSLTVISSDYHLGTKRQAHTTRDSAKRLQEALYEAALSATDVAPGVTKLCAGDLFDKAYNDEATLVQGYNVARRCHALLSGNHDETNREGAVTSLHALAQMDAPVVASPNLSKPHYEVLGPYWMVPHHASQELFEKALQEAMEHASQVDAHPHRYLLLHCNYDCPFDTEDSTLNLDPADAQILLGVFDRIFIGHEHNPKELHDGRIVLVGNIHPTSFSDVSDKYVWHLNPETDELDKELVWSQARRYREVTFGEPIPDLTGAEFVDVIGSRPAEDATEVARFVREVWEQEPGLLAVRNNVELIDHLRDTADVDSSKPALVDLNARIQSDLQDSDLLPLYNRLAAKTEEA